MDITHVLTAMLPFSLIIAGILSVVVSAMFLKLYRRATLRGMARTAFPDSAGATVAGPSNSRIQQRDGQRSTLRLHEITGKGSDKRAGEGETEGSSVQAYISRSQRNSALIYLAAGLAFASVMTLT